MFYYIFFIICIIEIINASIKKEEDIINALSNHTTTKVTLNIDSEIDVTEEIKINSSITTLYITGNSPDSSKLNLKYPLYFDSSIKELEIKNISIDGNLFFKNNEKIILDSVHLNGYIDSEFDENSKNSIEITKLDYKSKEEFVEYCINLSGNIKIKNSNFIGNSSCRNRLLHYRGFKKYSLDLKESNFNGEYGCPFLSIEKASYASIKSILFEKGYSSFDVGGGAGIKAISSNVNFYNCTFNDIVSFNEGGAFYLKDNIQVIGSNLNFNNVTSLGLGSIFHISSYEPSIQIFNNIVQKNTGNIKYMRDGGLFMNIEGHAKVNVTNYYAENIINNENSGALFILSENVVLTINDVYVRNLIGNGDKGGLFYTSHDSINIEFNAYNVTLYDLYQLNEQETSILYFEKNNFAYIKYLYLYNSGGYNTNFVNILDNSYITISHLEVDYFESKTTKEFMNVESEKVYTDEEDDEIKNVIKNCKITNVISEGALFRPINGIFDVRNCEFQNIHECYKYNNCTSISSGKPYVEGAVLMIGHGKGSSGCYFTSTKFKRMYGDNGILIFSSFAQISYSSVKHSYFKNGFLHWDEKNSEVGYYSVTYTKFENNTSECGTVMNCPYANVSKSSRKKISFKHCEFYNNTASKFGGVIYTGPNARRMIFKKCEFEDNHAAFGNDLYALSNDDLPEFENVTLTDIATVPTYFKRYGNIDENISILSGEKIPKGIMCRFKNIYIFNYTRLIYGSKSII